MNSFFHVTSKDPERRCHYIKPFTISKLNSDTLKNGTIRSQEAIEELKKKIININNSREGILDICCKQSNDQQYNTTLLNSFRTLFPSVREVRRGGNIIYLELSTIPVLEKNKGWQQIKPYHICKLTSAKLQPFDGPDSKNGTRYKAINLTDDCYTANCDNEDTLSLEILLKENTDPIEYSYYDDLKMYQSIEDGNIEYIKSYLFKYNKINKVLTNDNLGNYIIHIATKYYKKNVYDLILAMRPNINIKNMNGDTPLHIACKYGHTEAINELLKLNAEVNTQNNKGMTPLMLAVQYFDKNTHINNPLQDFRLSKVAIIIKTLIRKGANINITNNDNETVLHVYIRNGNTTPYFSSITKMLLDNGVDVNITNNEGKTALELASDEIKHLNKSDKLHEAHEFLQESFIVDDINENNLTPREIELREVQTMLFNQTIKSNSDKYSDYINVKDIPKGAPIEVLNYVCTGDNPDIHGIEDKKTCESLGGIFIKVKKPTTKVKLELIPETQIGITQIPTDDLYHTENPEPIHEKELPDKIQQINMIKNNNLNNIKDNVNNIKQIEDEIYIDRDNILPNSNQKNNFNNIVNNNKKKKTEQKTQNKELFDKLLNEPSEPPIFYPSQELTDNIKSAYKNSNNLMINTKSNISKNNYNHKTKLFFKQYFIGIIIIVILLIFLFIIVYSNIKYIIKSLQYFN